MPQRNASEPLVTGILDWSRGVNSIKVTTQQTQATPNGLAPGELAWAVNCRMRDGGIYPRAPWIRKGFILDYDTYQGGWMYRPHAASPYEGQAGSPYLVLAIGGSIYLVDVDSPDFPRNLSDEFGLYMPTSEPYFYFCQAEEFLVIQAGDGITLPLFWDGATLRRSRGITNTAIAPGTPGVNEIPAATAMDYYMGRLWYAQDRQYSAGDIVGGNSGTAAYGFRDSVLNVTENPLVLGGDGFTVPDESGNIRALAHNANLNTALGQGLLFIFTRRAVYSLTVPVTRNDWIAADTNNQPLQSVVQLVNGSVNDRTVVAVNGDLFYQSYEPDIRSLISAIRYFDQWGNQSIAKNIQRVLQYNDRALMFGCSGVAFNNYLFETMLPEQSDVGVISKVIVPMDFIPISGFGQQIAPAWNGILEGLDHLQLFVGDFGGLQRCFTIVRGDAGIELWEITQEGKFDVNAHGEARIQWQFETPAFNWGDEFLFKELIACEFWIDRLYGTTTFLVEWRPDSEACWKYWHKWQSCAARNCVEDVTNPCGDYNGYPIQEFGESFRSTLVLPKPPQNCESITGRPAHIGYQFQLRVTIKGFCRVRGITLYSSPRERALWDIKVC